MAIDKTWGGTPVYGRFTDDLDARYPTDRRLRKTSVYMKQDDAGVLLISTANPNGDYRPTRLTPDQARRLRDCIDEFLADQEKPPESFLRPLDINIPDPRTAQ